MTSLQIPIDLYHTNKTMNFICVPIWHKNIDVSQVSYGEPVQLDLNSRLNTDAHIFLDFFYKLPLLHFQ
jgi:hypothetical protein